LPSEALAAVTEQVPVPLVIETKPLAEFTKQAPVDAKLTAPVPEPPEAVTVNVAPKACAVVGMPVTFSVVCVAVVAETVAAAEVVLA
jgi:hypothetical protein